MRCDASQFSLAQAHGASRNAAWESPDKPSLQHVLGLSTRSQTRAKCRNCHGLRAVTARSQHSTNSLSLPCYGCEVPAVPMPRAPGASPSIMLSLFLWAGLGAERFPAL